MGEIDDKTRELERKGKNSNIRIIIIIVVGLAIFAGLFINGVFVKEQSLEDAVIVLNRQEIEVIKEDSILRELQRVQGQLKKIERASYDSPILAEKIDELRINFDANNQIPVDYYRREKDGMAIMNVLGSSKNPQYQVEEIEVYNDEGRRAVNTLYVGKSIKREYIRDLLEKLKSKGVPLDTVPYISARGTEWKDNALEIGYERDLSEPNKNANTFVRVYSYKPDENKKIKKRIEGKLGAKGYQVRVFRDWGEKPSFFSSRNTILYYDSSNLDQANDIARVLANVTELNFSVKMGAGLGVLEEDRTKVFIIHYNGEGSW